MELKITLSQIISLVQKITNEYIMGIKKLKLQKLSCFHNSYVETTVIQSIKTFLNKSYILIKN